MHETRTIGAIGLILALVSSAPAVCCLTARTAETHSCYSLPSDDTFSNPPCCSALTCAASPVRQAGEPASIELVNGGSDAVTTLSEVVPDWHGIRTARLRATIVSHSPTLTALRSIVLLL